MVWLIRLLGMVVAVTAVLQIKRSLDYPKILSNWKIDESKINLIVRITRVGGLFGLLIGIWLIFFVKV